MNFFNFINFVNIIIIEIPFRKMNQRENGSSVDYFPLASSICKYISNNIRRGRWRNAFRRKLATGWIKGHGVALELRRQWKRGSGYFGRSFVKNVRNSFVLRPANISLPVFEFPLSLSLYPLFLLENEPLL